MTPRQVFLPALFALCALWPGGSVSAETVKRVHAFGYPSVEAALSDLRKADALVRKVRPTITLMFDRRSRKNWHFTRPAHPAHPAAYWTKEVRRNGERAWQSGWMCRGEELACKRLVTKSQEYHKRRVEQDRRRDATKDPNWKPAQKQLYGAVGLAEKYFKALEANDLKTAYSLLGPLPKSTLSYDAFIADRKKLADQGGGDLVRKNKNIQWYLNTISTIVPGLYAATIVKCQVPKQRFCTELLELYEPPGRKFSIIRHETSFADPATLNWRHGLWDNTRSALGAK